ncbi:hypothetical protein MNB_SV-15-1036 [hydrothermal vent metagenome]|uniref:Uncharacterized protein n=1 Tax=hydrothermal vent metagenome TaxID=652676 RepID=A0A1W1EKQ5_9ZZZZ
MNRFIILYPISLLLLFIIFYFDTSIISYTINSFQQNLIIDVISQIFPNRVEDNFIIITNYYKLSIDKACNGIVTILFFIAPILLYQASIRYKIIFILIGYIILTLANIIRITFITYMVIADKQNFSLSHDFIGNIFLLIVGISLFIIFIKLVKAKSTI